MTETPSRGAVDFISYAKCLALTKGDVNAALGAAESNPRVPERVRTILRSAVQTGTTTDPLWAGALTDYKIALNGLLETLRPREVFTRIKTDGAALIVPLHTRVVAANVGAHGSSVAEGAPKPLTRLTLASNAIPERKSIALVVFSDELVRAPGAEALIGRELRGAVADATDSEFLAGLIDSSVPTVTGSGPTAADFGTDLAAALAYLRLHAGSRLYLVVTPDVAARLAVKMTNGVLAFPDLAVDGGSVAGITVLASDSLPPAAGSDTSNAMLIDAAALALADDTLVLSASRQAALQMDDAPSAGAAAMVSLFQSNLVALRAERYFGFEQVRGDGVVVIEEAAW